jgi:stress-induced morphogen
VRVYQFRHIRVGRASVARACRRYRPRSLPSAVVSTEPIKALLEQAFPNADELRVIDRGGGDHLEVHVTDASMQGLSLIDQHRRVNDVLGPLVKDGTIHELRIKTRGAPET